MKVGGSIKKRCDKCKQVIRRRKTGGPSPEIICVNRRHRQRQG